MDTDDIKGFLSVTPENLAEKQYKALERYASDRLEHVARLIRVGDFANAKRFISHSPAGDGHGCENDFITFELANEEYREQDIGDVIRRLEELKLIF